MEIKDYKGKTWVCNNPNDPIMVFTSNSCDLVFKIKTCDNYIIVKETIDRYLRFYD